MSVSSARMVFLETFGCQMNQSDSEVVMARLAEAGYAATDDPDAASLVVFNTCSVRDGAEAKIRGRLDALKQRKQRQPDLRVAVMGCMAQRAKGELLERWPLVDVVVGTDQFVRLPELLEARERDGRLAATDFGDFEAVNWTARRSEGINAWVPVMRGCNYNCTYCVVPSTRGREKSREPGLIENEVREAVAAGHVQITLLGQTVDAYGKTLGDGSTLASLLRRLHAIDGLQRLRFVTSHPKDITDELLHTIAELPKVAKHLHVPAQCGSDRILRLMGRRYDRAGYLDFVRRARAIITGVELLTDIIVGFPRETDDDYQQTYSLFEEVRFDGAYIFQYSSRPGTSALRLEDDVPEEVKRTRCVELQHLQLAHQEASYRALIGATRTILIEGPSKTNPERLSGRSQGNLNIHIERRGDDGATRDHLVGRLVEVRILRHTNLSLFAEPVGPV